MHFSLLQLPLLAIREVLIFFELKDLFHLSICSKKCNRIARWSLRGKSINEECRLEFLSSHYEITFRRKPDPLIVMVSIQEQSKLEKMIPKSIEYATIGGYTVPIVNEVDSYQTFWFDYETGLKMVIAHITKLFSVDIRKIFFGRRDLDIMGWVDNRQVTPIYYAVDVETCFDKEGCHRILTDYRISNLCLKAEFPLDFVFDGTLHQFHCLEIKHGWWITTQNLLSFAEQCVELKFYNSTLTCQNLNHFLKHWVSGGMDRLKFLVIVMELPDFNIIYGDLATVVIEESHFYTEWLDIVTEFPSSQAILRDDGKIATMFYDTGDSAFFFAAWDN